MHHALASAAHVEHVLLHNRTQGSRSYKERPPIEYKLLVDPPLPSATITDLCNEPLFFNSYLSDEEESSASEEDDMSFSTSTTSDQRDDDLALDAFVATFPELLAEECSLVEQQCNHAQAVMLVAAGRPKMVHVAKVDVRSLPVLAHSLSTSSRILHRRASRKSSISRPASKQHNREYSNSFSSSHSMPSTPEIPSTPHLEDALSTPSSSCTPTTPKTPRFDPSASPTPTNKSSTPTANHFRSFNQYRLEQPDVSKRSTSQIRSVTILVKGKPSQPLYAPSVYPYHQPQRTARPADERAPRFELPPYPGEEAQRTVRPSRPWATLRNDSFGPVQHTRDDSKTMKSRVRKMESIIGLNSW